ncbi:MAG: hypothetical protein H6923_07535 [Alphaproteobacteria bacterium]|nr:hypothetical protein [Alphaproteobacteria bacterium]
MTAAKTRILIYSHDTLGLGHLRRARALAHALVDGLPRASVLIVTGSPFAGSFAFGAHVDFVRLPGVTKRRDGSYQTLSLPIPLAETVKLRRALIAETARAFDPDLLVVDKEPLGLKGELEPALDLLERRGARRVLGLRDVLDAPDALAAEWARKRALPALARYDQIWVYGLAAVCDPLAGLPLAPDVAARTVFTGYLPRRGQPAAEPVARPFGARPFLLVTAGGGADGAPLIDGVLKAYESGARLPWPALVVAGPFCPAPLAKAFSARARRLADVAFIGFEPRLERLVAEAAAVLAMGGYNTFCEILTYDRPALLVPRTGPRAEQTIRARRAEALGLAHRLATPPDDTCAMLAAIERLASAPPPSAAGLPDLLTGSAVVVARARDLLAAGRAVPRTTGRAEAFA